MSWDMGEEDLRQSCLLLCEAHSSAMLSLSMLLDSQGSSSQAWSPSPKVLLLWLCVAPTLQAPVSLPGVSQKVSSFSIGKPCQDPAPLPTLF